MSASTIADPDRRRVLLLTQDLEPWGAQRQVVELAMGLDRARYDVRMGALQTGGPLTSEVAAAGIPIEGFPRRWRWDLSPIVRLANYLKREAIDVVHSFLFLPNFYARCAGRLAGTPAVVSSLRSTVIEGRLRYLLDVAMCFMCDALIANCAAGRDHYVRRGGLRGRIVVVRNGLNEDRLFRPMPTAEDARALWGLTRFERLVGMTASLEPLKDHSSLIEAMHEVVRVNERTGLLLAGDGSRRPSLEALVRSLGLDSHVVFLGTIREPEALYRLLDVYVQASHVEGISNSLLEAMAHSLPVVATDVGGNREVVVEGRTGFLVPPGDPKALARAIITLLDDDGRRLAMGREGRDRMRTEFSLESMVAATEAIYDRILCAKVRRVTARASAPAAI